MELHKGLQAEVRTTVATGNTAREVGSGSVAVFATPMLVALMESAAIKALHGRLPEGETTVGMSIDLRHLAPTPVGMEVRAVAELTAVDGRRLTFNIEAFDEREKVGQATHERFIVNREKFMDRSMQKRR